MEKGAFLYIKLFAVGVVIWMTFHPANGQCNTENKVFGPGELVNYNAFYNWKFIWLNAGKVSFAVDSSRMRGSPVFKLTSIGTTHRGYDRFYPVRDTFEVFVDPVTIKPIEYRQITNEGSYTANHHYVFNSENRTIRTTISREGSPFETTIIPWPDCSFDVLSMIYQARNIEFSKYKKGDQIPITLIVDGEIHNLYIRYHGKEVAQTRDGRKFNCLKFSPLLVAGTIFNAGEDMTVWVTDDLNRVPIVVEAKILIGSVKAMFTDAVGLKHPLTSEIKSSK